MTAAVAVAAYLLGSVPFAWLMVWCRTGLDLREEGSGNVGATNAGRVAGRWVGIGALALDAGKGAVAVAGALQLEGAALPLVAGGAAIVGHLFPIYLGFRGGKGVATAAGVYAVLAPLAFGCALLAFAVGYLVGRRVSVGSLTAATVLCVAVLVLDDRAPLQAFTGAVSGAVWWSHRGNLRRLCKGA